MKRLLKLIAAIGGLILSAPLLLVTMLRVWVQDRRSPLYIAVYTVAEQKPLSIHPGISDFASIVFSDEDDDLSNKFHPNFTNDQLIRLWKSRSGLINVGNSSLLLDIQLIICTFIDIISKPRALEFVVKRLQRQKADAVVIAIARRDSALQELTPPGAGDVAVQSRGSFELYPEI